MSAPGHPTAIDGPTCDALVQRLDAGDERAWHDLVEHLWTASLRIVAASKPMRAFGASADDVENVATALLGKLGDDGRRGLRLYALWRRRFPAKDFADWYRIALSHAVQNYVRDHLAATDGTRRPQDEVLDELVKSGKLAEPGERPAVTAAQTARQLREHALMHLPAEQCEALMLWIEGASFEEVAEELGLEGGEAAKKQIRAAIAALRRHFEVEGEKFDPRA